MRYKGFDVLAFPTGFGGYAGLGAVYSIYRDGLIIHHEVLVGPFGDSDSAVNAAEVAATKWIDLHGNEPT